MVHCFTKVRLCYLTSAVSITFICSINYFRNTLLQYSSIYFETIIGNGIFVLVVTAVLQTLPHPLLQQSSPGPHSESLRQLKSGLNRHIFPARPLLTGHVPTGLGSRK